MHDDPNAQWAADPYRRHEFRYWDGRRWTAHVSDGSATGLDDPDGLAWSAPAEAMEILPTGMEVPDRTRGRAAVPGHGRATRAVAGTPLVVAGVVATALVGVVAGAAVMSGLPGGGSKGSVQPLAAVSSAADGPPTAPARVTTAKPVNKKTKATTTSRTTTSTSTSTRPRTSTSTTKKPATTSRTSPRPTPTPMPPSTTKPPQIGRYRNCTAMRADWPHGVGRAGAKDHTSGSRPVTDFHVDNGLYMLNAGLDRDDDQIACEA